MKVLSITATNAENYVRITVSNGRIGILSSSDPFKVESIILNNVYEKESELGVSKIVKVPNFMDFEMYVDGEFSCI
ncbi:MAG: hypothetical protein COB01_01095 [Lutibacter sp.]|nr:MAG: hypothetical protein COB01_01095 [Lutibacter sp.]